jgi:hypothetical protein
MAAGDWCATGMPEREVVTGIGAVAVRCPRARDRAGEGGERTAFCMALNCKVSRVIKRPSARLL